MACADRLSILLRHSRFGDCSPCLDLSDLHRTADYPAIAPATPPPSPARGPLQELRLRPPRHARSLPGMRDGTKGRRMKAEGRRVRPDACSSLLAFCLLITAFRLLPSLPHPLHHLPIPHQPL